MKPADPGQTTQAATGGQGYAAANDDQGPTAPVPTSTRDVRGKDTGWDPFEVWRTRVRDARRGWQRDAEI